MNQQEILEELLFLLETSNVEIRREAVGGSGGGLCTISGKLFFYLDTDADYAENIRTAAQAVRKTVAIENIYITPEVRDYLEAIKKNE